MLTRDPKAFWIKAPHLAGHPAVEMLEGDLVDCDFGAASWEMVIHAAVEYREPLELVERNLKATQHLLDLAARWGASRVLFTSSGAIYGPQPPDFHHLDEDYSGAPPLAGASAYGEAKRVSELLGLLQGDRHGFAFLIARCFTLLGPWLSLDRSAAGNFIDRKSVV